MVSKISVQLEFEGSSCWARFAFITEYYNSLFDVSGKKMRT